MAMDRKLESSLEGMEQRLEGSMARMQEDMGAQMQQFIIMFTCQKQ